MTTIVTLEDALINWAAAQLPSRTVLLSSAGEGAQPRTSYCTILLRTQEKIGYQSARLSSAGDTEDISNVCHCEVRVDLYYGEAKQDAAILRASLAASDRFLDLYTVCGLVNDGLVEDLTDLETGAMKQRARFTFVISADIGWTFSTDSFNQVVVDLERADLEGYVNQITIDGSNA